MSTSTSVKPAVHGALAGLIDYAGMFPPATLALGPALEEYRNARAGPHEWMLGRFIIRASQLVEGGLSLPTFGVCVIVDVTGEEQWFDRVAAPLTQLARLRQDPECAIETIELALPRALTADDCAHTIARLQRLVDELGLCDVRVYLEIPRTDRWAQTLAPAVEAAVHASFGVKLRCGGTTAAAFPTVAEVAEFVYIAQSSGAPFKATAGLHHPIRHVDPATGFTMHGFLNLLAAAAFAPKAERTTLECIVAEENPDAFAFTETALVWQDLIATTNELALMRHDRFHAYGSCSFSEPVDDLIALGILPTA